MSRLLREPKVGSSKSLRARFRSPAQAGLFVGRSSSTIALGLPNCYQPLRWPDGQIACWKVGLLASNHSRDRLSTPAQPMPMYRSWIHRAHRNSSRFAGLIDVRCVIANSLSVPRRSGTPHHQTVTCLGCSTEDQSVLEGHAGASALREYDRRHQRREQHARETLGSFGVLLARMIKEPQSTRSWQQGGKGEVRTGERLAKHLDGCRVRLLHDRRIPRHGNGNIDHLAVGPGGVTVIDTKTHRGKIRTDRVGGLFSPRRTVLLIGRRYQTRLIAAVERQIEYVRSALNGIDDHVDIRGAICFPNADGLPLLGQLVVRDVIIDVPKQIARLAQRPGPLSDEAIDRVWRQLGHSFPPA